MYKFLSSIYMLFSLLKKYLHVIMLLELLTLFQLFDRPFSKKFNFLTVVIHTISTNKWFLKVS